LGLHHTIPEKHGTGRLSSQDPLIEPFATNSRIPALMVISNFQTPSSTGVRAAHHKVCVLKMLGWRFEGVPSFSSGGYFRRRSEGSVRGRTQRAEGQPLQVTSSSAIMPRKTKAKKDETRDSVEYPPRVPSIAPSCTLPPQVILSPNPRRTPSQAAMAGLDFCFIASTCSFILFFMSFIEGSALWVAIIQL
jgi:hypothetical protein